MVSIFNSGYEWNWLVTLNQFLGGVSWGAGLVLVFCVFAVFVNSSKSPKGVGHGRGADDMPVTEAEDEAWDEMERRQ